MSKARAVEPGAIQPIGFLVALSSDWMISHVSANITAFVDKPIDEIIGHHVNSLLCPDAVHSLRNRLALLRGSDAIERLFRCALFGNQHLFDIALHMGDARVIVEAEPSTEQPLGDCTGTVRGMIGRLDQARDMVGFLNEGARQVRALTGYDRVTITRSSTKGADEVVAQSARSGSASLRGRDFLPGDIPSQKRKLGGRSRLRVITDIEAQPVSIVPAFDEQSMPLDLSLSVLRSPSPIDIEDLRNTGVRASMSIAIIIDGALWGLVDCHHASARCPGFERRSIAELFAQMFAMRLEVRELKEMLNAERRARAGSD